MMMMMGWRCIKTGQAPNSKVARTPTLPIPPISTLGCILLHCIELACSVLFGREVQSVELEWWEDSIANVFLNCISQLYSSIVCLNCISLVYFWVGSVGARSAIRWTQLGRERGESVTLIFTLAAATQICSKPAASCNPDLLHTNVLNPHKNNTTRK